MSKKKDLFVISIIYIVAYVVGLLSCYFTNFSSIILQYFVFDVVATVVTFIFSTILVNSSVYDPYWSLTPMVMSIWLFIQFKAFSIMQILFLIAFNIWGARLTINWITVFTDFSYEDWRYRKFRNETSRFLWPIVNFFGIHMIPTLVVFAGMLPLFSIVRIELGILSVFGIIIMLAGVLLEYFADVNMHRFLMNTTDKSVCTVGLWNYSRHPNYLGEMTFWVGVFLAMIPYDALHWHYAVGFSSVIILFNIVSIPLMEKRQLSRRPEYEQYRRTTSRLLILPHKKHTN